MAERELRRQDQAAIVGGIARVLSEEYQRARHVVRGAETDIRIYTRLDQEREPPRADLQDMQQSLEPLAPPLAQFGADDRRQLASSVNARQWDVIATADRNIASIAAAARDVERLLKRRATNEVDLREAASKLHSLALDPQLLRRQIRDAERALADPAAD